jgi:glutaminyl-peptide cyclotransferase
MSPYPNALSQISMFVLLDRLGSANPIIPSYSPTTHWVYKRIAAIEGHMRKLGLLETKPKSAFLPETEQSAAQFRSKKVINDDHVPFMERGVPVLRLAPEKVSKVWHTMDDNGEHLDISTVRDWARIVTAFVYEWLDMMEVEPEEAAPEEAER